jgi:hypothetical protein
MPASSPFPRNPLEQKPQETTLPVDEHPLETDEQVFENLEGKEHFLEEAPTSPVPALEKPTSSAGSGTSAPALQRTTDPITLRVEQVLETGLGDLYVALPPEAKPAFKAKGEEVSQKIAQMIRSAHFTLKEALMLIRNWLMTIPGVNRFFLEQEAKVKVDALKHMAEEEIKKHL